MGRNPFIAGGKSGTGYPGLAQWGDGIALTRNRLRWFRVLRGQQGIGMLETLAALGILGFIGLAFMTALSVSFKGTEITDEQVTAENLARAQLEYIRDQDYCIPPSTPYTIPGDGTCGTYDVPPPGITPSTGYTNTLEIADYCDGQGPVGGCYDVQEIQKLTARVSRDGKLVTKVEDLKTNR
jgi:type II secretory pathway pseudopilin PulG